MYTENRAINYVLVPKADKFSSCHTKSAQDCNMGVTDR